MGLFAQVGRPEFAGRTLKDSLTSGAECGAELHPLWISGSTVDTQATPGATERGPGLRASLARGALRCCASAHVSPRWRVAGRLKLSRWASCDRQRVSPDAARRAIMKLDHRLA